MPAERIAAARAVLGDDTAAGLSRDEAERVVAEFLLLHLEFPPPEAEVQALRSDPGEQDAYRRVGDAALRLVLLDADARTMVRTQLIAAHALHQAFGAAEAARLGHALAVLALHDLRDGGPTDARDIARQGVARLAEAVMREPARAQPALVLCLEALARAEAATGDSSAARAALDRAITVLDAIESREGRPRPERPAIEALRDTIDAPTSGRGSTGPGAPAGDRALADADRLFDRGVDQSRSGAHNDADRTLAAAEAIYARLDTAHGWAGVARARWRRCMVVYVLGRTAEALRIGRDAIAAWRTAVRASGAEPTWPGEMATTLTDVSVMLGNAGEVDEAVECAAEAVTILRSNRPVDTAALATALHNVATTISQQAMVRAPTDSADQSVTTLHKATVAADEAIDIRESLSRRPDLIHRWELANTLLLRGRLHTILGDVAAGQRDLDRGLDIARAIGAADLLGQAQLNVRMLRDRRLM